ncbi:MAG: exosome complex RNA-binding protein Csl4 [Ignisphaera sp.]
MANKIVVPGEFLCTEEEFIAYIGTYAENGVVRAIITGHPVFDLINRRVYIKPVKDVKMPKSGDVVIGLVEQMRDEIAMIRLIGYDINKPFKHEFRSVLHISQASSSRIQSLYDVVRIGDIVRVRILNSYIPYVVTAKDAKLGVIAAYCSRCGAPLVKEKDRDILRCSFCGNVETRKIAPDYMFVNKR